MTYCEISVIVLLAVQLSEVHQNVCPSVRLSHSRVASKNSARCQKCTSHCNI